MSPLRRQVIIVVLCLAATLAAKVYVDRVLVPDVSGMPAPSGAVTVETPIGPDLAQP